MNQDESELISKDVAECVELGWAIIEKLENTAGLRQRMNGLYTELCAVSGLLPYCGDTLLHQRLAGVAMVLVSAIDCHKEYVAELQAQLRGTEGMH